MEITTEITVEGSGSQNSVINTGNTGGGHFPHFGMIGANLFERFEAFRENNNNNNPPLLSLSGFKEGLRGGFNLPLRENAKGLDPNVVALVNALIGANLGINYVKRESNHVNPIKFGGIEVENPNEWLEWYNRIAEANKWSEYRRFQIIEGYLVGAAVRWYDEIKTFITSWEYFQHVFLIKFTSLIRKNTWYLKYKSCKQVERTIDEYAINFQANWKKVDEKRIMPADSILTDFISELDFNILMLLYGLVLINLDESIMKAKMIEME